MKIKIFSTEFFNAPEAMSPEEATRAGYYSARGLANLLEKQVNKFCEDHDVKAIQYQPAGEEFTVMIRYEDKPAKRPTVYDDIVETFDTLKK